MARATSGVSPEVIKLAVTHPNLDAFMGEYKPSETTVNEFIQQLSHHWHLGDPSSYMLQYRGDLPHYYVCDANQHMIKNGVLLELVQSAPLLCDQILAGLNLQHHDKTISVTDLIEFATDPTFVSCFIDRKGLDTLMMLVAEMPQDDPVLGLLLQAFTVLLNTARITCDRVDWDMCQDTFIQKLTILVETSLSVKEVLLLRCLTVLHYIVSTCQEKHKLVEKNINLVRLMQHLSSARDLSTRRAVLALVTALFARAEHERKQDYFNRLSDRKYRSYITDNVLTSIASVPDVGGSKVAREERTLTCYLLHRLQRLLLNQLQPRMMTGVAPDDAKATQKILELRKVAFEADSELQSGGSSDRREDIKKEYKKLGFKNDNPAQDFNDVPPGVLALDNLHYFCHNRPDQYSKLVLENCYRADSHECPIGKASIDLTRVLANILKIDEPPQDDCPDFHPMLFTNDHPFEELFCICISLLNKTWKEMKAATEDFPKVLSVVQEQITRALQQRPPNLDQFQKRLQELTYKEITKCWHNESKHTEELEMRAPQIQKLRQELRESLYEVVQQQRLRLLQAGARFRNPTKKGRNFFCKLSPNHKFFHHDECDEKAVKMPALDDLTKKISVADIKSIATGKECPQSITRRKLQFVFSLILGNGKTEAISVDFVAPDEYTFNTWIDGVKVLLREKMCSEDAERDINKLLEMEVKLQLLDLEGVHIPTNLPPLPKLPSNYNFCCNL